MTSASLFQVRVLRVGHMPQAPACGTRLLADIGRYEPFCYTMLVARSPTVTVVVNAGFPVELAPLQAYWRALDARCQLQRDEEDQVERRLAQAGVDPARVNHLLLSPLGPYSTGRLELFTGAKIHVGRRAWQDFIAPPAVVPPANPHHLVMPPATLGRLVTDDWPRLHLLEDEAEVCPGVRVFRTGGHHDGSLAVVIQTAAGPVAYTDVVFSYRNLEQNHPIGFYRSLADCYHAMARLRRENLRVMPMFDPEVFNRHPDGLVT